MNGLLRLLSQLQITFIAGSQLANATEGRTTVAGQGHLDAAGWRSTSSVHAACCVIVNIGLSGWFVATGLRLMMKPRDSRGILSSSWLLPSVVAQFDVYPLDGYNRRMEFLRRTGALSLVRRVRNGRISGKCRRSTARRLRISGFLVSCAAGALTSRSLGRPGASVLGKTGERVRITAQLIDAKTGHHMWAEKYDRDIKDIFELQDDLTLNIMAALEVRLTEGEQARLRLKRSCNLEAILKALKALEYLRRNNKDAIILARENIQEAISLCPDYSEFYTLLAYTHLMELYFQTKNPLISIAQTSKAVKKAISLDENSSDAYLALGRLYLIRRQHDQAIATAEKAVSLNPNGADAYCELGYILYNSERYVESVEFINKAIRLNPLPPSYYFLWLGHSKRGLKRYKEAAEVYKKSAELEPNNLFSHLQLAITYELMGQEKAAKAAAAQVVIIDPTFSIKRYEKITPFKNRKVLKQYLDAAKKAGLSE